MKKEVIYKEPDSYFNSAMLKAAKEWDKKNKKTTTTTKSSKKGK